jgi:hypothetical protein
VGEEDRGDQVIARKRGRHGGSLDYDLGEGDGLEGYDQLLWMAEHDAWLTEGMSVHSSNPPGSERLRRLIERYGPYWRAPGTQYFGRQ